MDKIPYVGKIVKNGTSYHISVPANVRKYMELEKGDMIQVELTVVKKSGEPKKDNNGNPINAVFRISSRNL